MASQYISPETLLEMHDDWKACRASMTAIETTIESRQAEAKTERRVFGALFGLFGTAVLALGAWLVSTTIRGEERVEQLRGDVAEHADIPEHRGTSETLARVRDDTTLIRARVDEIGRDVDGLTKRLDEVEDGERRPRRRGDP